MRAAAGQAVTAPRSIARISCRVVICSLPSNLNRGRLIFGVAIPDGNRFRLSWNCSTVAKDDESHVNRTQAGAL